MTHPNYKAALNVLSHLVLTKPQVAQKFLMNHQVKVREKATPEKLLDQMIDIIAENDPVVMEDLISLFASHLTFKGQELLALGGKQASEEDQFLGGALAAASGIVKGISGLFTGKKKRKAAEDARKHQAKVQAEAIKREKLKQEAAARLQAFQIQQQQLQENRRRAEAERLRQDRLDKEDRERKEDKASNARQQKMMMIGAGGLVVLFVLVLLIKNRPRYPQSPRYNPPPIHP